MPGCKVNVHNWLIKINDNREIKSFSMPLFCKDAFVSGYQNLKLENFEAYKLELKDTVF